MDINKIEQAIIEINNAVEGSPYTSDFINLYNKIYDNYGEYYNLCYKEFSLILNIDEFEKCYSEQYTSAYDIDRNHFILNILDKYPNCYFRKLSAQEIIFAEDFIVNVSSFSLICNPNKASVIWDNLHELLPRVENKGHCINYVMVDQSDLVTKSIEIKDLKDMDISLNYNNDFDYELVTNLIREKTSSLLIFNGEPGTGKTTILRKLIADNKDISFYWFDSKLLTLSNNNCFIDFLLNHGNSVYILEDCESLLRDRGNYGNELLSTILNISDGMLGDSLNIRFICTFNADLNKIDKALLRKGRLSLQYEFKKLTVDKVKALSEYLGLGLKEIKEMPLCDIYNYHTENGAKKVVRNKVGFS